MFVRKLSLILVFLLSNCFLSCEGLSEKKFKDYVNREKNDSSIKELIRDIEESERYIKLYKQEISNLIKPNISNLFKPKKQFLSKEEHNSYSANFKQASNVKIFIDSILDFLKVYHFKEIARSFLEKKYQEISRYFVAKTILRKNLNHKALSTIDFSSTYKYYNSYLRISKYITDPPSHEYYNQSLELFDFQKEKITVSPQEVPISIASFKTDFFKDPGVFTNNYFNISKYSYEDILKNSENFIKEVSKVPGYLSYQTGLKALKYIEIDMHVDTIDAHESYWLKPSNNSYLPISILKPILSIPVNNSKEIIKLTIDLIELKINLKTLYAILFEKSVDEELLTRQDRLEQGDVLIQKIKNKLETLKIEQAAKSFSESSQREILKIIGKNFSNIEKINKYPAEKIVKQIAYGIAYDKKYKPENRLNSYLKDKSKNSIACSEFIYNLSLFFEAYSDLKNQNTFKEAISLTLNTYVPTTLLIKRIIREQTYFKDFDKSYKSSSGKNFNFSSDFFKEPGLFTEIDSISKEALSHSDSFISNLFVHLNSKTKLNHKKAGYLSYKDGLKAIYHFFYKNIFEKDFLDKNIEQEKIDYNSQTKEDYEFISNEHISLIWDKLYLITEKLALYEKGITEGLIEKSPNLTPLKQVDKYLEELEAIEKAKEQEKIKLEIEQVKAQAKAQMDAVLKKIKRVGSENIALSILEAYGEKSNLKFTEQELKEKIKKEAEKRSKAEIISEIEEIKTESLTLQQELSSLLKTDEHRSVNNFSKSLLNFLKIYANKKYKNKIFQAEFTANFFNTKFYKLFSYYSKKLKILKFINFCHTYENSEMRFDVDFFKDPGIFSANKVDLSKYSDANSDSDLKIPGYISYNTGLNAFIYTFCEANFPYKAPIDEKESQNIKRIIEINVDIEFNKLILLFFQEVLKGNLEIEAFIAAIQPIAVIQPVITPIEQLEPENIKTIPATKKTTKPKIIEPTPTLPTTKIQPQPKEKTKKKIRPQQGTKKKKELKKEEAKPKTKNQTIKPKLKKSKKSANKKTKPPVKKERPKLKAKKKQDKKLKELRPKKKLSKKTIKHEAKEKPIEKPKIKLIGQPKDKPQEEEVIKLKKKLTKIIKFFRKKHPKLVGKVEDEIRKSGKLTEKLKIKHLQLAERKFAKILNILKKKYPKKSSTFKKYELPKTTKETTKLERMKNIKRTLPKVINFIKRKYPDYFLEQ